MWARWCFFSGKLLKDQARAINPSTTSFVNYLHNPLACNDYLIYYHQTGKQCEVKWLRESSEPEFVGLNLQAACRIQLCRKVILYIDSCHDSRDWGRMCQKAKAAAYRVASWTELGVAATADIHGHPFFRIKIMDFLATLSLKAFREDQ